MNNITVNELLKLGDNTNIIDIRGKENYNNGYINNAINIPSEQLLMNPSKYLLKDKTYYIYCQRGMKSVKICQILHNYGYNTVNILGGYQSYILLK